MLGFSLLRCSRRDRLGDRGRRIGVCGNRERIRLGGVGRVGLLWIFGISASDRSDIDIDGLGTSSGGRKQRARAIWTSSRPGTQPRGRAQQRK
jgi:hypothetical protein